MSVPVRGLHLRSRLGPEACEELSDAFEEEKNDMLAITSERFEQRLIAVSAELRQEMTKMDAGIRVAITEGLSKIRAEMGEMRVDTLRWAFLFWLGQVAATGTLLAYMLRGFIK